MNSPSRRGLLCLFGALACFAWMDASAKWLSRELPPLTISGARYGLALIFVLAFLRPWSRRTLWHTAHPGRQFLRGVFLVGMTLGAFTALRQLPLSQVTAICFAAPLLTALLAGPVLGEKIGPRRLIAVGVGFAGVLVITRPWGSDWSLATGLAVAAALSNACYFLTTRLLAQTDAPETTMLYTSLVGAAVVTPPALWEWETPLRPAVAAVLVILGACGALGHWLLILAHRHTPASALAPFFYTQILGSLGFGYVVFAEIPDRWTLLGAAIVIGSGLYLLAREKVRRQHPSADPS